MFQARGRVSSSDKVSINLCESSRVLIRRSNYVNVIIVGIFSLSKKVLLTGEREAWVGRDVAYDFECVGIGYSEKGDAGVESRNCCNADVVVHRRTLTDI